MKKTTKTRGITLIALVVTIVVLLILAGVTLNLVLGNNGIVNRAKDAKEKTLETNLKEEINLVLGSRAIDKNMGIYNPLKKDLEDGVSGNKIVEEANGTSDLCYVTRDGYTVSVYDDGEIYEDKVDIWDGENSEVPGKETFSWDIYNSKQLKFLADFVNNGNELTEEQKALVAEKNYNEEDIKITETTIVNLMENLDLGARQENGELTVGKSWTPIGIDKTNSFIGTFNGNNHKIKGLYIKANILGAGLFGRVNGNIKDLEINSGYIEGENLTGAIAGALDAGSIENCKNINTTVKASKSSTGGIVGQATATVKNCYNSGTVTGGNMQTGGIVGHLASLNSAVIIEDCVNEGNITGAGRVGRNCW